MNPLAIAALFAVNLVFNIEAALVEFLLPLVAAEFGIAPRHSQLLLMLYYGAIMVTLATSLSAGIEELDTRTVLFSGSGVFALGCLCLVSGSYGLILVGRVLQGAGVAAMVIATPAIIAQRRESLNLPFSPYALIPLSIGLGLLAGPTLGSVVIALLGVKPLLAALATLSLGTGALIFALPRYQPRTVPVRSAAQTLLRRFDYLGVLATALTLAALYAVFVAASGAQDALVGLSLAAVLTVLAVWLFNHSDRESDWPVLDVQFLFRDSMVGRLNLVAILSFAATYAIAYVLPFYVYYEVLAAQEGMLLGGTMAFVSFGFIASVGLARLRYSRNERGMLVLCGGLMGTASLGFLSAAWVGSTDLLLGAAFLMGLSRGAFVDPYNSLTLHTTPVYRIDASSGYNAVARYLGMTFGVICGAVALWRADGYGQALEMASATALTLTLLSVFVLFVAVDGPDANGERTA